MAISLGGGFYASQSFFPFSLDRVMVRFQASQQRFTARKEAPKGPSEEDADMTFTSNPIVRFSEYETAQDGGLEVTLVWYGSLL